MNRILTAGILGLALIAPISLVPLRADDHSRSYRDKEHNDEHHWDNHEDRAYRIWVKQNHRKYSNFERLREDDQRSYWAWRHEHSDAILKINIR